MEHVSGNIYIRPNRILYAGGEVVEHRHDFDHTTICFHGAMLVEELSDDGAVVRAVELRSPRPDWEGASHVLIKAGACHRITAREDDTHFWCVYSHRNPQGEVVQVYEGWDRAHQTDEVV